MPNYLQHLVTSPQVTQPLDARQAANHGGGFAYQISCWDRLHRWLILGSEGGTYYQKERELTLENAKTVVECLEQDAPRAVAVIVEISTSGRAPKNAPAVLALALAATSTAAGARPAALEALPAVCRTGTDLFQFVEAVDKLRGWGRGLQRGVAKWYADKSVDKLAYQVVKYQQRNGWSHRDVLRLVHLHPAEDKQAIYRWIVQKDNLGVRDVKRGEGVVNYPPVGELPPLLAAYEELKKRSLLSGGQDDIKVVLDLIRTHKMTHEMIPGELKARTDVWEALLEHMPMGALVRNLGQLTSKGVIAPLTPRVQEIASRLQDTIAIHKARLHPVAFLSALRVYEQGHGDKGSLSWRALPQITQALEAGFYEAFKYVEPTGKAHLFGIDCSGSMSGQGTAGIPGLTARECAAVMAMVVARREPSHMFMGFCNRLVELKITSTTSLMDATKIVSRSDFGTTDCSLILQFAHHEKLPVDAVVTITDNEVNTGKHPKVALEALRQARGIPVKNAVIACTPTEFSIADPNDVHSMDFVGFDSNGPALLAEFIKG